MAAAASTASAETELSVASQQAEPTVTVAAAQQPAVVYMATPVVVEHAIEHNKADAEYPVPTPPTTATVTYPVETVTRA